VATSKGQTATNLSKARRLKFQQPSYQFFSHTVLVQSIPVQVLSNQVYHKKSSYSDWWSVYSSQNHTIWRTTFCCSSQEYFQAWCPYELCYVADKRIRQRPLVGLSYAWCSHWNNQLCEGFDIGCPRERTRAQSRCGLDHKNRQITWRYLDERKAYTVSLALFSFASRNHSDSKGLS